MYAVFTSETQCIGSALSNVLYVSLGLSITTVGYSLGDIYYNEEIQILVAKSTNALQPDFWISYLEYYKALFGHNEYCNRMFIILRHIVGVYLQYFGFAMLTSEYNHYIIAFIFTYFGYLIIDMICLSDLSHFIVESNQDFVKLQIFYFNKLIHAAAAFAYVCVHERACLRVFVFWCLYFHVVFIFLYVCAFGVCICVCSHAVFVFVCVFFVVFYTLACLCSLWCVHMFVCLCA